MLINKQKLHMAFKGYSTAFQCLSGKPCGTPHVACSDRKGPDHVAVPETCRTALPCGGIRVYRGHDARRPTDTVTPKQPPAPRMPPIREK